MREYIITGEQLKTATEAYLEHELSRPITEVFISGDKLPEIVRCGDCECLDTWEFADGTVRNVCSNFEYTDVVLDGFCAWGVRRDA